MNFWKDGLSVDETRFSVLLCLLIIGFGYALYAYHTHGDFSNNLLELLKFLIFAVAGINAVNSVSKVFEKVKSAVNKEVSKYDL